jgi:hypothetical protein
MIGKQMSGPSRNCSKINNPTGMMAHTCNSIYSGSRDQKDYSGSQPGQKVNHTPTQQIS